MNMDKSMVEMALDQLTKQKSSDINAEDLGRIRQHIADPKFMELFQDYMTDLQDPKFRAEQNAYFRSLEGQAAVGEGNVVMVPQSVFSLAVNVEGGGVAYVNVCSGQHISQATCDKRSGAWSLPYAQGRPRVFTQEVNKTNVSRVNQHPYYNIHAQKILCDVYDVIFAQETLTLAKDPAFRMLLIDTALDAVNATLLRTFSPKFENKDLTKLSPVTLRDVAAPVRLVRRPPANTVRYTAEEKQILLQAVNYQQIPVSKRSKQAKDIIARSEEIQKDAIAKARGPKDSYAFEILQTVGVCAPIPALTIKKQATTSPTATATANKAVALTAATVTTIATTAAAAKAFATFGVSANGKEKPVAASDSGKNSPDSQKLEKIPTPVPTAPVQTASVITSRRGQATTATTGAPATVSATTTTTTTTSAASPVTSSTTTTAAATTAVAAPVVSAWGKPFAGSNLSPTPSSSSASSPSSSLAAPATDDLSAGTGTGMGTGDGTDGKKKRNGRGKGRNDAADATTNTTSTTATVTTTTTAGAVAATKTRPQIQGPRLQVRPAYTSSHTLTPNGAVDTTTVIFSLPLASGAADVELEIGGGVLALTSQVLELSRDQYIPLLVMARRQQRREKLPLPNEIAAVMETPIGTDCDVIGPFFVSYQLELSVSGEGRAAKWSKSAKELTVVVGSDTPTTLTTVAPVGPAIMMFDEAFYRRVENNVPHGSILSGNGAGVATTSTSTTTTAPTTTTTTTSLAPTAPVMSAPAHIPIPAAPAASAPSVASAAVTVPTSSPPVIPAPTSTTATATATAATLTATVAPATTATTAVPTTATALTPIIPAPSPRPPRTNTSSTTNTDTNTNTNNTGLVAPDAITTATSTTTTTTATAAPVAGVQSAGDDAGTGAARGSKGRKGKSSNNSKNNDHMSKTGDHVVKNDSDNSHDDITNENSAPEEESRRRNRRNKKKQDKFPKISQNPESDQISENSEIATFTPPEPEPEPVDLIAEATRLMEEEKRQKEAVAAAEAEELRRIEEDMLRDQGYDAETERNTRWNRYGDECDDVRGDADDVGTGNGSGSGSGSGDGEERAGMCDESSSCSEDKTVSSDATVTTAVTPVKLVYPPCSICKIEGLEATCPHPPELDQCSHLYDKKMYKVWKKTGVLPQHLIDKYNVNRAVESDVTETTTTTTTTTATTASETTKLANISPIPESPSSEDSSPESSMSEISDSTNKPKKSVSLGSCVVTRTEHGNERNERLVDHADPSFNRDVPLPLSLYAAVQHMSLANKNNALETLSASPAFTSTQGGQGKYAGAHTHSPSIRGRSPSYSPSISSLSSLSSLPALSATSSSTLTSISTSSPAIKGTVPTFSLDSHTETPTAAPKPKKIKGKSGKGVPAHHFTVYDTHVHVVLAVKGVDEAASTLSVCQGRLQAMLSQCRGGQTKLLAEVDAVVGGVVKEGEVAWSVNDVNVVVTLPKAQAGEWEWALKPWGSAPVAVLTNDDKNAVVVVKKSDGVLSLTSARGECEIEKLELGATKAMAADAIVEVTAISEKQGSENSKDKNHVNIPKETPSLGLGYLGAGISAIAGIIGLGSSGNMDTNVQMTPLKVAVGGGIGLLD